MNAWLSTSWVGLLSLLTCLFSGLTSAQSLKPSNPLSTVAESTQTRSTQRNASQWLMRMHEASRRRAYVGTFVVMAGGSMASSRIWHACDGDQQIEKIESLNGSPRTIYRRNDQVVTFAPQSKVAVSERRQSMGLFPGLLKSKDSSISTFYAAQHSHVERVAGFDADVVNLLPKDPLRFGYRIWSEKITGLAIKLQTLDNDGRVLEQVAFSDLRIDVPLNINKLHQMMIQTEGYRVEKQEFIKTDAWSEGWILKPDVPGFNAMNCYRRPALIKPSVIDETLQCVFSDGLASVSLFIEPFDRKHHSQEALLAMGATHTLTRRIPEKSGDWWLTAVGEVPSRTLIVFAQGLERRK